jgi:hypothetical protein
MKLIYGAISEISEEWVINSSVFTVLSEEWVINSSVFTVLSEE